MRAYRNYVLAVLTVIFTFNFVDRIALGLVLENIKLDLHLTDTELGLLGGIAFALFYSLMGLPIARWADRGNRVTIIALTATLWSVMVALCGRAMNFVQLMLVRVAVGVGEAGCVPPAQSLIADYFSRTELPRAIAVYWQGANLSLIIGYFVAGWLNQYYGWRTMFIFVGLPGLACAALAWFTLRDPREAQTAPAPVAQPSDADRPSFREVLTTIWGNRTFRHLLYAFCVFYFFLYGTAQWQPTFFVRSFGLQSGQLGTWLSIVYGLPSIIGMHLGGEWASRRAGRNERLQLRVIAVANAIFNVAAWAMIYFARSSPVALAWMALACFGGNVMMGPMNALPQTLMPARMRATAVAIVFLFANLIGMGFGPLAVGVLSDHLSPLWGRESLRYSLLIFTGGYLWLSWHLWAASNTVEADMAALSREPADVPVAGAHGSFKNVPLTRPS
jgi:MFS transporter, Spinster family, sphingosine-1-phosphate transporter